MALEFSIVIPVHNEVDNVQPLVAEIHNVLEGRARYEIIFVDDGSTDDTPKRLAALVRMEESNVRVTRHAGRCGQSTAISTGVKLARAPWIVCLDGDGQNDPADIPKLLAKASGPGRSARVGLVMGVRRDRQDSRIKRVSSVIANRARAAFLDDGALDSGCGLKLFARDVFLSLPFFDHMHRFMPALVRRQGYAVESVEVGHRPRAHGRSHYGVSDRLWVGIVDLLGVYWLQRRMRIPVTEYRREGS